MSSKSSETTKAVDPTKEDDPKTVGPSSSTAVMRQIGEEAAKRAAQFKASKTTTGQSVRFQTTDSPRSERNLLPELARSAGIPPPSVIAKSDVKKVETPSDSLVEAAAEPLGSSGKPVHPETVEGKPILEEEKPMVEKEKEKGRPTLEEKKPAMEEEDKESGQFPVQPALKAKESKDAPKTQAQSPIDGDAAGISVAD